MISVECASTSVHRLPIIPKLRKIEKSGITKRVAGSIFAVSADNGQLGSRPVGYSEITWF